MKTDIIVLVHQTSISVPVRGYTDTW